MMSPAQKSAHALALSFAEKVFRELGKLKLGNGPEARLVMAEYDRLRAIAEHSPQPIGGILDTVEAAGEEPTRAMKRMAKDIAWNIILKADGNQRQAAEQAALATIVAMKAERQLLTIRTITGPKDIPAPAQFEFDKTATMAWARLVRLTQELEKPAKRQRDRHVLEGQIDILALVLSDSLGFAKPYWTRLAEEFAKN